MKYLLKVTISGFSLGEGQTRRYIHTSCSVGSPELARKVVDDLEAAIREINEEIEVESELIAEGW